MRKKMCVGTKAALSSLGSIIMMSGNLVFSQWSLLDYLNAEKDSSWYNGLGVPAFLASTYVLIFTRSLTLWNYFNNPTEEKKPVNAIDEEMALASLPREPESFKKLGISIGVLGSINAVCYSFFGAYLGSETLLALLDADGPVARWILSAYVWFSLIAVYLSFSLPRAINNAKDIVTLFSPNESEPTHPLRRRALIKTAICTSLGTLSFAGLAHFLVQNAQNRISFTQHFSDEVKTAISFSIAALAFVLFALSKSLESYQYFLGNRHFSTTSASSHPSMKERGLRYSHHVMGYMELGFEFTAYFRVNLDLFQSLGADISLEKKHWGYFLLATVFSSSSVFIEYVFTYQNMLSLSRGLFSPSVEESQTNQTMNVLLIEKGEDDSDILSQNKK